MHAFNISIPFFSCMYILLFMYSTHSWVDLMTVIPSYATIGATCPSFEEANSFYNIVYYILCGLNATRILRSLRFLNYFDSMEDEVQRFLAGMGLKIVVMILFSKWIYSTNCYFRVKTCVLIPNPTNLGNIFSQFQTLL